MNNFRHLSLGVLVSLLLAACGSDSSPPPATPEDQSGHSSSASSEPPLDDIPRAEFEHTLEWDLSASLNALEAGVVADDGTDQTDALNAAVDQVYDDQGLDTLYIPEGVYRVAGNLRPRAGVNIVGDGIGKTVLVRNNPDGYLVAAARDRDLADVVIAKLSLHNPVRTVLLQNVSNLAFREVEFHGGLVRFEGSSYVTIDSSLFLENQASAAYSSDQCEHMTLTNNTFNSIVDGSINLSRHSHSYVANNTITADHVIQSGYAGIRLPNNAHNNLVENNTITNHGRGLFVLSSSTHNTLRNNVVDTTAYQGVFIEASDNVFEGNTVINAGDEAFLVQDAVAESSPTPSIADRNVIRDNIIEDTRAMGGERNYGLRIYGDNNTVTGNSVSTEFGRICKDIGATNTESDNVCVE
ncbi:right-handed parallel beta-helix repeat-containing protein [Marinimicrobium alkaliphilum]|uniref:right-handed parallel beta-helix repeat-containing protein n=1 Tax=Marinimicrobium alkaliphilum TaxID=2202654 RepID=UPI000DBA8DA1|nr:right-handed parallel beta-helix repeat-containing protein [Marinimicrobium alkaliphilum]